MVRKYVRKGRELASHHTQKSVGYAKNSAAKFRKEFRKHLIAAVSAALGFLIALSWREPLSDLSKLIISNLGLEGEALFFQFISAVVITVLAVIGLIIATRWGIKPESAETKKPEKTEKTEKKPKAKIVK
jgi:uncharacterized membrane protein YdbT with pleckstrin-like domain